MEIKDLNTVIKLPGKRVFCVLNKQVFDCYVWDVSMSPITDESEELEFEIQVVRRDIWTGSDKKTCSLDRIFWTSEEAIECLNEILNGKPILADILNAKSGIIKAMFALDGYKDAKVRDIVARLKSMSEDVEELRKQNDQAGNVNVRDRICNNSDNKQ